ncbi:ATP-binding protein, partial [Robertmurraya sp. DFI.2.37]|nr:ATP-binding protein [Robertmurraya sp. DFI.2.37]
ENGFSTESTPGNRGAGLNNILTSVLTDNKGTIHIHSNKGIIDCTYGNNEINTHSYAAKGFYPGTFIEIVLNTQNIFNIENEEEDFEWF